MSPNGKANHRPGSPNSVLSRSAAWPREQSAMAHGVIGNDVPFRGEAAQFIPDHQAHVVGKHRAASARGARLFLQRQVQQPGAHEGQAGRSILLKGPGCLRIGGEVIIETDRHGMPAGVPVPRKLIMVSKVRSPGRLRWCSKRKRSPGRRSRKAATAEATPGTAEKVGRAEALALQVVGSGVGSRPGDWASIEAGRNRDTQKVSSDECRTALRRPGP